jgi:hypothetical protein
VKGLPSKKKWKMTDGKVGSKEFTVKGGMGFCRRKFMGEKDKVLPGASGTLLQHSTELTFQGVFSQ